MPVKRLLRAVAAAAVVPLLAMTVLMTAQPAAAASLTQVTNFGNNPSNLNMYLYVPDNVAPKPALLVLIHYCGGSGPTIFNGNGRDYVTAADRYGYVIVLPEVTRSSKCFDVYSPQGLRRGGGSDSDGIISMVNYARQRHDVDPARVYVSGFSSGAMMTNVMAAQYPDVFAAGSAFSGVPATCFATGSSTNTWNSQCAGGQLTKTAQQWGDAARAMYPGYTGRYPRMQFWHGTTDTTLSYVNFGEEIKQWTNLHGLSQTPVFTDRPQSNWTRTRYGDSGTRATIEGVSISGVGHELPQAGQIAYAISFLGLDGAPTTPTPSLTTPPPTAGVAVVGNQSGRCLEVPNASTTNGVQTQLWDCTGGTAQRWTRTASRQLQVYGSKCLDASGAGTSNGTQVIIWDCHGGANQQWNVNANGTITNAQSGLCLDANAAGTANGTRVILWSCNGQANQQWTLRS
ncbi:PHB depolymerase family esterase [Micromonospora sp. KC207]|uniref:extracellular catalytic domain type 1 short-chain-length polyhydroxyalkanoate depolymerase n=1 Tax=Micromonospora sp. KC207 TaxID=2530377 RepID=UPI00104AC7A9|nr:PHB depolymerase family esterase [Micromonospora sp. KC207]TDC61526.1 PHB depolymerase family esterase [Micromonospora sp. KC207]